jgi:pimeloyl-ACP methyl ester carboxylesterase
MGRLARGRLVRRARRLLGATPPPGAPIGRDAAAREEDSEPILMLDGGSGSRTMLLALAGLKMKMGVAPFEFLNLTGSIPVKRMFVRDLDQAWYHRGLPGHGDSLVAVAAELRELIAAQDVDRLIVTGASAGGYAALAIGTLLDADLVLSFSPQTVIDLGSLAKMGDHRWDPYLKSLAASGSLDPEWSDLRVALGRCGASSTVCNVYFDELTEFDRLHAERLKGLPGVRLLRFAGGSHNLVRTLRDNGALEVLLRSSIEGRRPGPVDRDPA